jgi:hypothetical protein
MGDRQELGAGTTKQLFRQIRADTKDRRVVRIRETIFPTLVLFLVKNQTKKPSIKVGIGKETNLSDFPLTFSQSLGSRRCNLLLSGFLKV